MLSYNGTKLLHPYRNADKKVEIPAYYPDPALVRAVNLAIFLRRPLLLMGEPGCGKTRLAEAVAYELYEDAYKDLYFEWNVKSTTKAQEGIYSFDAIARLRLADRDSLEEEKTKSGKELEQYYLEQGYLSKGELAKAIDRSQEKKPAILLIDEIDKADIDFPNDLLLELDKTTYYIPETRTFTTRRKEEAPIIFITSNNEKELPAAFLRRCIFHYIQFPDETQLLRILEGHFETLEKNLAEDAIAAFIEVRNKLQSSLSDKKLSTSELIDWFRVLQHQHQQKLTIDGKAIDTALKESLGQLKAKARTHIPFHQVLLKNWESILAVLPMND